MMDIDGNNYHSVNIGDQVWLQENLRVTHYRNGEAIPNILNSSNWSNLMLGAFCVYQNNNTLATTYGYLYNWYSITDGRKIAPTGWHVATEADWQKLFTYLGGIDSAGAKMQEAGLSLWSAPNLGATNVSGFTARPGGFRLFNGTFSELQNSAFFWRADQTSGFYELKNQTVNVNFSECSRNFGLSVRCVKD